MVAVDQSHRASAGRREARKNARAFPENGVTGAHALSAPLMIYFLALLLPFGFSLGGIALGPVRLLLLVMFPILLFNLLAGKYGRLRAMDGFLFAFLFWQGVAIGYWHGSQAIQFVGSVGLEMMGGYLMARAYIRSVRDYEALARVFGLLVLVTVPFAIGESLTGKRLVLDLFGMIPGIDAYGLATQEARLGMERAQVIFKHPIHYGIFCALGFSMSFVIVRHYVSPAWGWVRSLAIAAGSFFSLSSGGFLIFVLQALLLGWYWVTRNIQKPWLILLVLSAIGYIVLDIFSNRSAFKVILTWASFSAHNAYFRIILFDYAMINLADSPLVGVGLNDWYRPSWIRHPSLDNFFAYVALVYGVPAFVFLAASWLLGLGKVMALKLDGADPALRRCRLTWVLTMVAIIFALCTVHVWGKIYSLVFFFFGSGIWLLDQDGATASATTAATPDPRKRTRQHARATAGDDTLGHKTVVEEEEAGLADRSRYTRFPNAGTTRRSPR